MLKPAAALALAVLLALSGFWWPPQPPLPIQTRAPAPNLSLSTASSTSPAAGGVLIPGPGRASSQKGAWPCFRGAQRDGCQHDAPRLARAWPASGPRLRWSVEVGEGYAGAAVRDGRVYLLDYNRQAQRDAVRCLSLEDGREIWRYEYPVPLKRNHGLSRTVPAVSERFLVTLGPKGHVTCLDPESGALRWSKDLVKEFGAIIPPWYAGQNPLLDGERAIVAPAGPEALVIAIQCATGQVLWRTPNPHGWSMTHTSLTPMRLLDRDCFLYVGSGGVAAVDQEDGRTLWETDAWKIRIAAIASPVAIGPDRIFLAGGYNAGSLLLRISPEGASRRSDPLFRLGPEVFGATQQTPITYQDHLYGVRPDGQLVCLDLQGHLAWASGPGHRFGLGPFLLADGLIFVLDDEGTLSLVEAHPERCSILAQARVLQGHDCWGPLALAGGALLVRDFTHLACLEVSEK